MDVSKQINDYVAALRDIKMNSLGERPIFLGELICALLQRPAEQEVRYDFGYFYPAGLHSYRGFYDHLALGVQVGGEGPTVGDLTGQLIDVDGKVFQGYKGGDFRMGVTTPIWVADFGECHETALIGIADCRWATVLRTAFVDL